MSEGAIVHGFGGGVTLPEELETGWNGSGGHVREYLSATILGVKGDFIVGHRALVGA